MNSKGNKKAVSVYMICENVLAKSSRNILK